MKETTIVYAHPYDKSFNHGILEVVESTLQKQHKNYTVLDLYKDGFNPVYSAEELKYFSQGKALDPLIEQYQQQLKNTKELIMIFPIWWYDTPAIVKGFFDKVMLNQFAYVDTNTGVKGLLTNIDKATVITTSKAPTWFLKFFGGNSVQKVLIKSTLKGIGVSKAKWVNMGNVLKTSPENRTKFLQELPQKFK